MVATDEGKTIWRLRIFVDGAAPEDAPYVETFCRELDGNLYRWEIRAAYGTGTSLALMVCQEFRDRIVADVAAAENIISTWATAWARVRGLQLDTAVTFALEDGTESARAVYPAFGMTDDGSIAPLVTLAP